MKSLAGGGSVALLVAVGGLALVARGAAGAAAAAVGAAVGGRATRAGRAV